MTCILSKTGPYEAYSVARHWQPEVTRILTEFFPRRQEALLRQFRERGLFPPETAIPADSQPERFTGFAGGTNGRGCW